MTISQLSSYLFALVDGGGIVPPELGEMRRLVKRGHRVEILADNSMIDDVRAAGAIFRPWARPIRRQPAADRMVPSGICRPALPLEFTEVDV